MPTRKRMSVSTYVWNGAPPSTSPFDLRTVTEHNTEIHPIWLFHTVKASTIREALELLIPKNVWEREFRDYWDDNFRLGRLYKIDPRHFYIRFKGSQRFTNVLKWLKDYGHFLHNGKDRMERAVKAKKSRDARIYRKRAETREHNIEMLKKQKRQQELLDGL